MVKILNKCILSILVYNLFQADSAIFFIYTAICPYTGILAVFMKSKFKFSENLIGRKKGSTLTGFIVGEMVTNCVRLKCTTRIGSTWPDSSTQYTPFYLYSICERLILKDNIKTGFIIKTCHCKSLVMSFKEIGIKSSYLFVTKVFSGISCFLFG